MESIRDRKSRCIYRHVSVLGKKNQKNMKSKKNFIAKDLLTKKYKPRIIKPKKGKGSFKRKKK